MLCGRKKASIIQFHNNYTGIFKSKKFRPANHTDTLTGEVTFGWINSFCCKYYDDFKQQFLGIFYLSIIMHSELVFMVFIILKTLSVFFSVTPWTCASLSLCEFSHKVARQTWTNQFRIWTFSSGLETKKEYWWNLDNLMQSMGRCAKKGRVIYKKNVLVLWFKCECPSMVVKSIWLLLITLSASYLI